MLRVRAIKEGHYKYHRRPGDEFEIDGKHQLGKWMKVIPVEAKPDEPKVKEKASPPEKPKAVAEPDSGEL